MVLPLGLCLLWALAGSQEICSSPGDLPAPTLILDKGSARHGDTIILLCLVPIDTSVTRIIFCKDGKEISMLPKDGNKFIYIFESAQPESPESAGEYSCRYQHKDDKNQEKNSLPSTHRHVSAPDGFLGQGLIVGLAVTAGLALGLLGCFLMKTATRQCKNKREQNAKESTDETAAGKLIDASFAGCSHYTGPRGQDKDTEHYESLNIRALEISPYSTLHLQQKREPAASASRLKQHALK
ncbi:uncharacterized protein LOC120394189 isoform X2 [Mauremys reevesii]|uniref:uncharacterized protein LOC120394189 isoform X2 n=1 Tax=Mauremys reevesii TaxID=260615 RepID=UPI00193FB638|nr:uncharacterized protein LOC120394189 isoform X2 [Mauremys reevesii]